MNSSAVRKGFWLACIVGSLFSPSPVAAQQILFESLRDGNFEIYALNADGSALSNLTDSPAADRQPRWSPDASNIAFVTDRDGNQEIYTMDADGGNKINLTNDLRADGFPEWSPDGSQIAFHSTRDGSPQIHVMNADGTNRLNKSNEQALFAAPRWSPDSSQILYDARRNVGISIILMSADGSNKVNLTVDDPPSHSPRWSPDGSRIVFVSERDGNSDIFVMNADRTLQTRLTVDPAADTLPQWSPDGTRILFSSSRDGNDELYVMNADGSDQTNLTDHPSADLFAQWSPDGTRIAFSSDRRVEGELDLYLMDGAGNGLTALTATDGFDFEAQLSGNFSFGQPPSIFPGGVVLSNLLPTVNTISPLSIISLFGLDFSAELIAVPNLDPDGKVDTILGGTCVEIAGVRAPIYAIFPTQANVQTPATVPLGPVGVVVIRDCDTLLASRSPVEMVTVEEATPGFFLFSPRTVDGFIAARFHAGAAPVAPVGVFLDDDGSFGPSRPARPDEIIILYGTGWGETDPSFATGELPGGAAAVLDSATPTVTFGGIQLDPADVFYIGVTPGNAGLFQLGIRVPAGAQPGDNQVELMVYGKSTPIGPVIPVVVP